MKTETKEKIAINSVEIEIGGTKLKLTLDQVAELKKILTKAFPDKETVYVPGPERIIERYRDWWISGWPKYERWDITCQSDSATTQATNGATLCLVAH